MRGLDEQLIIWLIVVAAWIGNLNEENTTK